MGINTAIAQNIVVWREENGSLKSRKELLKVSKLGAKTFEQCAGFLRIPGAKNILDNTSVHPESYEGCEKLLKLTGHTLEDVAERRLTDIQKKVSEIGLEEVAQK